jgi:hypothetical protein
MKYTVLFLTLLAMSSFVSSQKAFDQVKSLLENLNTDVINEQSDADIRKKKDDETCAKQIEDANLKINNRSKDVDNLKDHIKFLENEIAENEKDKKQREDRIVANNELLKKFKAERCEANILFVKSLREHMEGRDILAALRQDINDYFNNKKDGKVNTAFLERFAEFSHLLSEEHRQVFLQLSQAVQDFSNVKTLGDQTAANSSTQQRTEQEVGKEHVDNNRGELQKLEHVAHVDQTVYADDLHKKVIGMIDALIQHLHDSQKTLTNNEIKAAEDFATFQTNIQKENDYLTGKIAEIAKLLIDLNSQLNNAKDQLSKREELLKQAKEELRVIEETCNQKKAYYEKETARRTTELDNIKNASNVFNDILNKLSQRVKERTSNLVNKEAAGRDLEAHVAAHEPEAQKTLDQNVAERKQVVF